MANSKFIFLGALTIILVNLVKKSESVECRFYPPNVDFYQIAYCPEICCDDPFPRRHWQACCPSLSANSPPSPLPTKVHDEKWYIVVIPIISCMVIIITLIIAITYCVKSFKTRKLHQTYRNSDITRTEKELEAQKSDKYPTQQANYVVDLPPLYSEIIEKTEKPVENK